MRVIATAVLLATCLASPRIAAQGVLDSVPDQRFWLSVGPGVGTGYGLAGDLTLWYAARGFAFGVQGNADDGFLFGRQRESWALVAGVNRGAGHHVLLGALGVGQVHSFVCYDDGGCQPGFNELGVAFAGEASLHATAIGIGLDTFGMLAPRQSSYVALALSLQLGYLGR